MSGFLPGSASSGALSTTPAGTPGETGAMASAALALMVARPAAPASRLRLSIMLSSLVVRTGIRAGCAVTMS